MSFVDVFTGSIVTPQEVSYRLIEVTVDTLSQQLEWPTLEANGENVAARIMDVENLTGNPLNLFFPPADQVGVGEDILINNTSIQEVRCFDFDGNSLVTIPAGFTQYFYLTENNSPAGDWQNFTFGAGTAAVDPALLAGYALRSNGTTLNWNLRATTHNTAPVSIPCNYSSNTAGHVWTGGAGTVSLGDMGGGLTFSGFMTGWHNSGTGALTFFPFGAQTINGASSYTLNPGESTFFMATPIEQDWVTIGNGREVVFAYSTVIIDVTGLSGNVDISSTQAAGKIMVIQGAPAGDVFLLFPAVASVYQIISSYDDTAGDVWLGVQGGTVAQIRLDTAPSGLTRTVVVNGLIVYDFSQFNTGGTAIRLSAGSQGAPPLNFGAGGEPQTGFFLAGPLAIGITLDGTQAFQFNVNGSDVAMLDRGQATSVKIATALQSGMAGATVTFTNLIPAGVLVLGVTTRVTTAITGATDFDIGDGSDIDKWGAAVPIAVDTVTDGSFFTVFTPTFYPAISSVVLTANGGNFATGAVRANVHYIDLTPPSS